MGRNCKTCKRGIPAQEKTYFGVSCNTHMHLTTGCTALSPAAINGIKELGMNAMLLCNTCVENNERDNSIKGRALASVSEKLESLDVGDKLKNMEKPLRDLVDSKIGEAMTTTCGKVEKTYAAVVAGYRNKCEFSIGTDTNGNKKTVGFRLSSYKSGEIAVVEPKCHIVSDVMQGVVAHFQTLIRESELEQYCVVTHSGHWRGLTVRSGRNETNVMVIVHFSPQTLSEENLKAEKERVHQAMTAKHPQITSFYWNCVNSISSSSSEIEQLELLGGDTKISEKVLSSTFRLSPTAFFQVNTLATELLYSLVCDWAGTSADSTVMDVCCGTGTVGIILAKSVHKVIGIEMSEDAIQDAKENAAMNNLNNIQYHCGKAEEILPLLAETLVKVPNVSAVVDPPRSGLHKIVIQSLRKCSFLTKLVYVSCNANAAITNWVDLCRPTSKKFAGAPFQMVKAQPVDLFPHTNHCELVVLFERPSQTDKRPVDPPAQSSSTVSQPIAKAMTETKLDPLITTDCVTSNTDFTAEEQIEKTDVEKGNSVVMKSSTELDLSTS
ncbi:tRNA (uracil-5-)-methyltransferase homolog A-like [Convolutriloba macropyga]|uniref:tRNA (uracil-5-)-methyltransferase homolog A-like n=1 Tax=Convolutriloba macropyga TaxID=536237 RepID=UPI003F526C11